MKRISQVVWTGGDNVFRIRLSNNDVDGIVSAVDLAAVTSMKVEIAKTNDRSHRAVDTLTVLKDDADPMIDWWDASLGTGEVDFKLGGWIETNEIPSTDYTVRLISYDIINPGGIYWSSHMRRELTINVVI